MNSSIKVGSFEIGPGHRPFVIAEMSGNHNHSLERAIKITEAAARAGAHALKLQTYTADTLTLDIRGGDFLIKDPNSLWSGKNLHDLYKEAYTPWEWHAPIMKRAAELGLICFSTPFDETAVDFLESLNVPLYKIASFENVHIPLIRRVAKTGKPTIISTGMATVAELHDAVSAFRAEGNNNLILLKCTSTYPATPENTNILTIPHMRDLFDTQVGLSDHTMGIGVSVASVALGATVIEKHFTLSRADGGVDSAFSMEPEELSALIVESERAWLSLGKVAYGARGAETKSIQFRRSVFVSRDIRRGETFTAENLRVVRPGTGLAPKFLQVVLGMVAARDLAKGTPLSWDHVGGGPS